MKKLMKNKLISKIIVIVLCIPSYFFTLIGEKYSSNRFTFIGTSAAYWIDIYSFISEKDVSILSSRIETKYYNKKVMKKKIKKMKNNENLSVEYKKRILNILEDAKRHGYRLRDDYFETDATGPLHLSFTKSAYSHSYLTYFVLNPDDESIIIYKGDYDSGYNNLEFPTGKNCKDIIPYLVGNERKYS